MSISSIRSNIARLQKDIADLRAKDAAEAKKEADLTSKVHQASDRARRASSASSVNSYLREIERAQKDLVSVSKRRADIAKKLAAKSSDLNREQGRLGREEIQVQKELSAAQDRLQKDQDRRIQLLDQQLNERVSAIADWMPPAGINVELHDVFISHASEDKESFVRELAEKLRSSGVSVWYDEFSLNWGDGLRRNIDRGLTSARFGIVVLSKAFFERDWPQLELDGLTQLELAGKARVLPIWHNVSKDDVTRHSPMLADKLALKTADLTVDEIVARLVELRDAALSDA